MLLIPHGGLHGRLRFGRYEVRPTHREVLVDGVPRELQPRAFDLLVYLIQHRERVLPAQELLDAVWGSRVVEPNSLAVAIKRIRTALADESAEIIQTHHRRGYRFAAAVESD